MLACERCRCLGALTWGSPVYKGVALTPRAPVLGVCIAAQLEPFFHIVFEVVAPGAWGCVFGLVLVEALLSVWLALWG